MKFKTKSIIGLFFLLFLIILINPFFINNLLNNILGRFILIIILILSSLYNKTIALLVLLVIISTLNFNNSPEPYNLLNNNKFKYYNIEGFENNNENKLKTKLEENILNVNKEKGVDKEQIKVSLQSLNSNTIPVNKNDFKNENLEVDSSNPKGKLSENFCSNCSLSLF